MLTIAILFMITGVLIPLMVGIRGQLEDKKRSMHAAETAYHSVFEARYSKVEDGERRIDGVVYHWKREGRRICIEYFSHNSSSKRICVEDPI